MERQSTSRRVSAHVSSSTPASSQEPQTSIVHVVQKDTSQSTEPELEALGSIEKFQPLIPVTTETGFNWRRLFSAKPDEPLPYSMSSANLERTFTLCREHIQQCTSVVVQDQKLLCNKLSDMDEYATKVASTILSRNYQTKQHLDQLATVTNIKGQAEKTHLLMVDIVQSLTRLDEFLLPEERLSHPSNSKKYPNLAKHALPRVSHKLARAPPVPGQAVSPTRSYEPIRRSTL
ncbi:uncharacterized protein BJ171DRAFT_485083 [Polychytrium aggregatum]|uniref:uncharacterized protein n=1 Tax=Polychytrium aggregatum TaxID=110093 RepID=UPI0022FDFC53|nr:uncharacterized protein BJ171DRAFT_485083 [Polychytrium aggregatum]KAI9209809.1 hypothetical protein BJ171DRAFT_485083 [Polychytrium aggregatum]